jgi:predicted secreted protein
MEIKTMTEIQQNLKWILPGTVVIIVIVSASFLWLNTPQQPMTCTINQTPGETLVIDQSLNNAVICTKPNNSVILRLGLYDRVGGVWLISNSTGLLVSDGRIEMFDPHNPGFGTEEWNVTTIKTGVQPLTATCRRFGSEKDRLIASQNLTFIVR